jgi:hypothetical protein
MEDQDQEGSWWDRAVDSVENTVSDFAHSAADMVEDVPVLGTIAEAGADAVDLYTQFEGGIAKGAGTFIGGVVNMVEHPIDTAMGLEAMAEHIPGVGDPLKVIHHGLGAALDGEDVWGAVEKDLDPSQSLEDDLSFWKKVGGAIIDPYSKEIEQGKYAEAVGRGVFDIGGIILTAGEGAAAEGVVDAGRVAEVAEVTAETTRGVEVASETLNAGKPFAGLSDAEIEAAVNGEPKASVMVQAPAENLTTKTKPYGDGMYTEYSFDAQTSVPDAEGNVRTTMKVHDADPTAPLASNSQEGPTLGIEQGKGNRRVVPDDTSDWGGRWVNKSTATAEEWNNSHIPLDE